MAGDVMSILRKVKFSLTAELIADWVRYLEMVAGASVVCEVQNVQG